MTILATFAALLPRRLAFGYPVHDQPCQPESAATSGPAQSIDQTRNSDGLALLQARRLALLTEARRLKCLRRSKAGSICEAELRRVTHQILAHRGKAESAGVSA